MTQDLTRLGEINALLGRGTEYEGKLCFEGRVRIDGKFRGEIHSEDMLILGDGSDVDADLYVGKLIVRGGTLRGRVFASQLVELFPPARVYADIRTPLFFVDRGVVFEGRCTMDDAPVEPISMNPEPLPVVAAIAAPPMPLAPEGEPEALPTAGRDSLETADDPDGADGVSADSDGERDSDPERDSSASAETAGSADATSEAKPKRKRARKKA